jgi:hypothetical protein
MTHWNYRIVHHVSVVGEEEVSHYALHEVFYGDDGCVTGYTENPITFVGDTREEVVEALRVALKDAEERSVYEPPEDQT